MSCRVAIKSIKDSMKGKEWTEEGEGVLCRGEIGGEGEGDLMALEGQERLGGKYEICDGSIHQSAQTTKRDWSTLDDLGGGKSVGSQADENRMQRFLTR